MPGTFIKSLFAQATATGVKDNVMKSLTWALLIVIAATAACVTGTEIVALHWLSCVASSLVLAVYLGVYIYCLLKDPDLLRGESFIIDKLSIEHSVSGDSRAGLVDTKLKALEAGDVDSREIDEAS